MIRGKKMIKTSIVIFYVVIFCISSFTIGSLNIDTNRIDLMDNGWNKTFGGSNIDVGHCVQQTDDGGYIITGYTRSYGASGRNLWLIKTDIHGDEEWNNTFGGSNDEEGKSVQQASDGGFIITGYTKSYTSGGEDVWFIKTDNLGNQEWDKSFGGSNDDGGTSVLQASDGGYTIAGYTSSSGTGGVDVWLIKMNQTGNEEWNKTFGGYSSDGAWSAQQTSDGGYIITGWTYSYGGGYLGNVWLIKTDSAGNEEWNQAYGGSDVDRGYSVQQTSDGGYIIAGYTSSFGAGLDDVLLIKTNESGNMDWQKTFGGSGRDYGYAVKQTNDGGYIITGYTRSYGAGGDDVWLIKTDDEGGEIFNSTFGGIASDVGYSVQQTSDDAYIITGHTLSYGAGVHDVWLIKTAYNTTTFSMSIDMGWNFISFPINQSVNNAYLIINFNESDISWTQATTNDNPTGSPIVDPNIFGWNRNVQSYTANNVFNPGYGYWLYCYQPCEIWIQNTMITSDSYITTIEPNWNIVSIPNDEPVNKADILVNDTVWADAVVAGLIDDNMFGWNSTIQSYNLAAMINPGEADWMYAYQPCILKRII